MRMFLLEKGQFVVIRNENGKEANFISKDQFYKYCSIEEFNINLGDLEYIDYEPDRNVFYISRTQNKPELIPVPDYDNIIDSLDIIIDRLSNPFWGEGSEYRWKVVRIFRTKDLEDCHWTQLPDVPMDEEVREAWKTYRQALRDVPQSGVDIMSYDRLDIFIDEVFPKIP